MNKSRLELTEDDRKMLKRIAVTANKPLWSHALQSGAVFLLLFFYGASFLWIPSRLHTLGIALCKRYGVVWLPVEDTPFNVQKLFGSAGVLMIAVGIVCTVAVWCGIMRDRRLHRLLSHAYPNDNVA